MDSRHPSHKETKQRNEETPLIWSNSKWSCKEGVLWRRLECQRCLAKEIEIMEEKKRKMEDLEEGELLSDVEI